MKRRFFLFGIAVLWVFLGDVIQGNADGGTSDVLKRIGNSTVNATDDGAPATVAGTRGLNESKTGLDATARNDAAIDQLDKVAVTPEDVQRFIKEGGLK